MTHVEHWAREFPDGARRLAAAFWPGPLTLILPRASHVDDAVTGGQDSVGLRMPAHPVASALLAAFAALGGDGIAAPSANRFGHVSPTTAQHVADDLDDAVAMILDGGSCAVGIESTIVAFTGSEPSLLRPGGIGIDALGRRAGPRATVAGRGCAAGLGDARVALRAARSRAIAHCRRPAVRSCAQRRARRPSCRPRTHASRAPANSSARGSLLPPPRGRYAHDLYANLRALDLPGVKAILIEAVPDDPEWFAVRDRLTRATN